MATDYSAHYQEKFFPVQLYSINILLPENRAVPQRSALILMVTGKLGASLSHTLSANLSEITLREVLRERLMCSVNSSGLKAKQVLGKPCSEEVESGNNGPSSRKENRDTDILKFILAATLWFGFHLLHVAGVSLLSGF